jgi:hypothetical protein
MQNAKCKMKKRRGFLRSVKDSSELLYLLKLIRKAHFARGELIESLEQEARQLCKIFGKSVITAKNLRM